MIKKVKSFALELTNACNLNCSFCANGLMSREKGMMDTVLAKRLIGEVKDTGFCDIIAANVMGEPLLHKGVFELLEYAAGLGQKVAILTNGEMLDEDMSRRLLEAHPAVVGISYHANSEESFSCRHPSISYAEYKKRICRFIELKFHLGVKTSVYINTISTIDLPHDKFRILDNLEELDSFEAEWTSFAGLLKKKYRIRWNVPGVIYNAALLLPGFSVSILKSPHLWSNTILPQGVKAVPCLECQCLCPFEQCNVLWNGDLTLCCIDYNGDLAYDNIAGKGIIEAFNSGRVNAIRKSFINRRGVPVKCTYCTGKLVGPDGSGYSFSKRSPGLSIRDQLKRARLLFTRLAYQRNAGEYLYERFTGGTAIGRTLRRRYWKGYVDRLKTP